ncbi:DUF4870 domain-containing protein [Paenisporosarcina sp. TG20]|uniref:DUF4870 domain-containing protein n=1 Tax=Paenisporosarcina sp. TG20 TaxID=1211706 RepID=UPI00030BF2C0|nr:DUF4870 domain-containing protein [Paenisporosarcina sp. TG20]
MDNRRLLSALCYFSILFAPFLLPIIVYFISPDTEVKYHAKRSIISHLIPVALGIIGFIVLMVGSLTMYNTMSPSIGTSTSFDFLTASVPLLFMLVYAILSIIVLIWNIVQGIKVLQ